MSLQIKITAPGGRIETATLIGKGGSKSCLVRFSTPLRYEFSLATGKGKELKAWRIAPDQLAKIREAL